MRTRALARSLALSLAFAFAAGRSRGADAPTPALVNLRWTAPRECPDEATMRATIQRNLPAGMKVSAPLEAVGAVTAPAATDVDGGLADGGTDGGAASTERWRVALTLRATEGADERVFEGRTCQAVSEAAALVISMALGASWSAPAAPPRAPGPATRPFVALAGVGDVGTLPQASEGLSVSAGASRARWRLGVEALVLRDRSAVIAGTPEAGARFSFAAASARACYAAVDGLWTVAPCVDGGLSRTRATGFGPIRTADAENLTVSLGAGLLVAWAPLRHVAPFFLAGGEIPVQRPRFSVENLGQVHRAAPVWWRASLGLELRFR